MHHAQTAPKTKSAQTRQAYSRFIGVNSHQFIQISPLCTPSFVLTPGVPPPPPCTPACTLAIGHNGLGSCCILISVSCDIGTAALGSQGATCRLEAVFLYGLRTFVHSWALAHFVPFWSHPNHAPPGYDQWCGCPLAPLVSPRGGLGPLSCATCASASGDSPPWQSRRTLTTFSTSLRKNTCGRSKDASTEVCPTGAHCGQRPWLCYVSGAAPCRLRRTMRNAKRTHTCLQNSPTMSCTPTPNFSLLLDAASHWGVAGKHPLPFPIPCSA